MALFALMALALARPTDHVETVARRPEVPSAIGLVFDTSLSMEYKEKDKTGSTRRRIAPTILKKTPTTSRLRLRLGRPRRAQGFSPAAARKRVEALTLRDANRPLNASVGPAYAAVAERQAAARCLRLHRPRPSAWDADRPGRRARQVGQGQGRLQTFVLRLTPKDIKDVAVVAADPSSTVATQGEPMEIRVKSAPGARRRPGSGTQARRHDPR